MACAGLLYIGDLEEMALKVGITDDRRLAALEVAQRLQAQLVRFDYGILVLIYNAFKTSRNVKEFQATVRNPSKQPGLISNSHSKTSLNL